MAEWHFGQNCTQYIPTLGKCRVLVGKYNARPDLVSLKPLSATDLLTYSQAREDELLDQIRSQAIRVKEHKDGKLVFKTPASWAWDDCPNARDGGQCLYYEPHAGPHIGCLKDLQEWPHEHPNAKLAASESAVLCFMTEVLAIPRTVDQNGEWHVQQPT